MDRTLLLVDDEENILRSLMRLLRRDGYKILTADGGQAGLDVLARNEVGVIVSDERMPGMSGVEFLSRVKALYPETVRIVLSGYTDLKSVTDAINEGAIYKFLTKPWDDDLLRANLKAAFKHYELARENERLAAELMRLNEELRGANERLARSVETKSRHMQINVQSLQVTQELLECLPLGVLGVGEDNVVAMANLKAHEILKPPSGLIGVLAAEVLPDAVNAVLEEGVRQGAPVTGHVQVDGGRPLRVYTCRLGQASPAKGCLVLLTPGDQGP